MEEARKYLRVFLFCVTLVFSLTAIIAGALTVRERTRKMIYGTDYAVLAFKMNSQPDVEKEDENELVLDFSKIKLFNDALNG